MWLHALVMGNTKQSQMLLSYPVVWNAATTIKIYTDGQKEHNFLMEQIKTTCKFSEHTISILWFSGLCSFFLLSCNFSLNLSDIILVTSTACYCPVLIVIVLSCYCPVLTKVSQICLKYSWFPVFVWKVLKKNRFILLDNKQTINSRQMEN